MKTSLIELKNIIEQRHITLEMKQGKLSYSSPKNAMTVAIKQAISHYKDNFIQELASKSESTKGSTINNIANISDYNAKENAGLDLFCLHYSGGSSTIFREWNTFFPDWITIRPIELPGRGIGLADPLISDPEEAIETLTQTIVNSVERPWALFGHSLGAALGYRVCMRLQETDIAPLAFFPAGGYPPTIDDPAPRRAHLTDKQLIEEIRSLGGTPEEVLENNELMQLLIPMIRSDFLLNDSIKKLKSNSKITCPVQVFAATEDKEVPLVTVNQWQDACEKEIDINIIEGNHFFVHDERAVLIMRDKICALLSALANIQQLPIKSLSY